MAVTAAFSGADYLAKKQLAKYAAKQVTEKLGEELAERLLKDGVDGTAIARAVRSLEKSGVDNAVIRKAAGELTATEFERIGSLAKRGLTGELLEKFIDNREVLGKASDSTLLFFKNSTGSCDDTAKVLEDVSDIKITFPQGDAQLKHIFRDEEGHLPDTPANRQKILDVTSNLDNYLGKDARGNDWYAVISEDGTQTWVRVRNGVIDNAGVNDVPRTWDSETGLYHNTKK